MKLEHSEDKFSLMKDNEMIGFLQYGIVDQTMYVNGIVVDPEYRGQGLASDLLKAGVEFARENKYKIIPRCSYAASAFDRGGYEDVDARE
ncbi:MAG: N-acetyltransferase [Erysipelothrix sp.]|nr:N-acetyltransferase [Erysipelothrix sp.]